MNQLPDDSRFINRTGHIYGRLTVLAYGGRVNNRHVWECQCECGNQHLAKGESLRSGHTKSCGCLRKEIMAVKQTTHGLSRHPMYGTYTNILNRCYNLNAQDYANYGKRGIQVCDRWRESFVNFLADMGERPFKGATVERRNNKLGYAPENCYWATQAEQTLNTRQNRLITIDGRTQPLVLWCRELNIVKSTVYRRWERGWSDREALMRPVDITRRRKIAPN